ncbi:MAG: TIGR03936 family radical SAM-associated protein [Candidatus Omnitrophota bacterium]
MTNKKNDHYKGIFRKNGSMVYISHLDLMTLFRRAMRRARVPFVITEGFTPRVKISMPKALKVGRESDSEEITFWLTEEVDPEELAGSMNKELPEGIRILKLERTGTTCGEKDAKNRRERAKRY